MSYILNRSGTGLSNARLEGTNSLLNEVKRR